MHSTVGDPWRLTNSSGNVHFVPNFAASCIWFTGFGGTTSYDPEVAASLSASGFSFYFPPSSYQDGAVSTFL